QIDDSAYLPIEDKSMGSDEWKLKEIQSIKSDSATLKDTDYNKLASGTNAQMSSAIDFLSSHNPSWSGYREAYDEFYTKDKRASIPISYIVKTSKSTLNKVLPSYRKSFAKNLANSLWEQDIYVTSSGSQNTILNFTGGIFASNKNIADMQTIMESDARHFGFKQIQYRWYKGANEYTFYDLKQ
ncbi:hypothetical protein JGH11_10930, partial [Dysgonomonas sp. Marseille-P4677]|uniref:hypothetical protein n=1 Tax=Dysgonomonas sp. Marseille-P4677 TaxID=2364790 RepID=UPI00191266BC